MKFAKSELVAIMVSVCAASAQAREASLTIFNQPDESSGRPVLSSPENGEVRSALRTHLNLMGSNTPGPVARYGLPSRLPQRSRSWKSPVLRMSPISVAFDVHPDCVSGGYSLTWWLPPEVEARRAAFFDTMVSIACEYGLPPSLLDAVIAQESGYKSWAISRAGAMGMMQVMPGTARALGLASPFDPIANMRAGARYLRQQLDRFGRIDLALAAYNAGPERRSLAAGYVPAIPETLNYVQVVTRNWSRLATTLPDTDMPSRRGRAAASAVLVSGFRSVELVRYDGMNSENPT